MQNTARSSPESCHRTLLAGLLAWGVLLTSQDTGVAAETVVDPELAKLNTAVEAARFQWQRSSDARSELERTLLDAQNQLRRAAKPLDALRDQIGELGKEIEASNKEIKQAVEEFAKEKSEGEALPPAKYPSEKEALHRKKLAAAQSAKEPLEAKLKAAELELKPLQDVVDQARGRLEEARILEERERFGHLQAVARRTGFEQAREEELIAQGQRLTFARHIAPLLVEHCHACHNGRVAGGDLNLETWAGLQRGGESGPILVDQAPDKSLLYTECRDASMPKDEPALHGDQLQILRHWIEQGAPLGVGITEEMSIVTMVPAASQTLSPAASGKPAAITALAANDAADHVFTAGYGEVLAWDKASHELRTRLSGLPERIHAIDFSPSLSLLAVAAGRPGRVGAVSLFDLSSPATPSPNAIPLTITVDEALAVRFSPDGKWLAAGGADRVIRWYDIPSRLEYRSSEDHSDWVTALAWTPDSANLLSASRDKSVKVISARTGSIELTFTGHDTPVIDVVALSNTQAASVALEPKVSIWNLADGKVTQRVKLPTLPRQLAYRGASAQHACLAVSLDNGHIAIYSGDDQQAFVKNLRLKAPAMSLEFEPTTGDLLAGLKNGTVVRFGAADLLEKKAEESAENRSEWLAQPK
ncbi:MAG: hypothetical protein C0478_01120 [Planctomyces sp.]|nr:hypothetical protein [Planctomyces sp.]